MKIRLEGDAQENGLALMLAPLIEQNVEQHPAKAKNLAKLRGDVSIIAKDEDSSVEVTLSFRGDEVVVLDGVVPKPKLKVTASYEDVILLSSLPMALGLPNLFSQPGREFAGKLLRRNVRIAGLVCHAPTLVRLSRVMSVVE